MSILSARNISLRFGGLSALSAINLEIDRGKVFSVIGPNGAGKTSFFNVVTGIYEPSEGGIFFEERDFRRRFTLRSLLGFMAAAFLTGCGLTLLVNLEALWAAAIENNYLFRQPFDWSQAWGSFRGYFAEESAYYTWFPFIAGMALSLAGGISVWRRSRRTPDFVAQCGILRTFQNIRLFHQMTALENVLIGMERNLKERAWHAAFRLPLHRREKEAAIKKSYELLDFVGLQDKANHLASSLPYGYQRRLEIARALAADPKILLLDEPAAGMNPAEGEELVELIGKIRERGVTVLLIEHHMNVVMKISDRIAVLDYGHKIAEGTPSEVKGDPKVVEAYLGKDN